MTENELIEKMARAVHAKRDGAHDYGKYKSDPRIARAYQDDARAALSALPIPLADLLAVVNGESVIVPVDYTDMQAEAIAARAQCCGGIAESIYRAAIQARPK